MTRLHVFIHCLGIQVGENFFDQRAQFNRLQIQLHPPGFERGNRQQILDQQIQPLRIALDDFEKALGDLRVVARAVEQRFDVAFDERKRRAQFVADVGDKILARAFKLLEPRHIVKDENRALAFAGGIGDDGGVDPQPAPAQFRQLEFVVKNLSLGLDARDQFGEFVQAQCLHDRLAAQLGFQIEQVLERAVGEVDPAFAVEQQQAFEHGIEQNLLLRLRINGCLLLASAAFLHLGVNLLPLTKKSLPPREMDCDGGGNRNDRQEWPHDERMKDEG